MNRTLATEIQKLGGDIADDVWQWFMLNGPHGSRFTWGQTRHEPPGYVGVEHLQRIVAEKVELDPTFIARARAVVEMALSSADQDIVRRAIQVAAVLGSDDELRRISDLTASPNASIAADAKASVFFLRKRLRSLPQ